MASLVKAPRKNSPRTLFKASSSRSDSAHWPWNLFYLFLGGEYLKTYLIVLVGSREPMEVFLPLLYKAAECGAQQFIEKIFDLPTARIIFNSSKHKFELLEGIARNHGHEQTALYFQKITTRYNLFAFFTTKRKFARLKHSHTLTSCEAPSSCEVASACYEISEPSIELFNSHKVFIYKARATMLGVVASVGM